MDEYLALSQYLFYVKYVPDIVYRALDLPSADTSQVNISQGHPYLYSIYLEIGSTVKRSLSKLINNMVSCLYVYSFQKMNSYDFLSIYLINAPII